MKFVHTSLIVLLCSIASSAQDFSHLTIQECYRMAKRHYPLIRQLELIDRTTQYTVQNASRAYLPQLSVNGQAAYQSEVTQIPIALPGLHTPTLSKDQYKLYGEANQIIYDGGATQFQQKTQRANGEIEKQKVEVELHKLHERINQIYFGVLLVNEQVKQQQIVQDDIQSAIDVTAARVSAGTALNSAADALRAELLKTQQRTIELDALRKAYLDMLGLFIGRELNEHTVLAIPQHLPEETAIHRPELKLYEFHEKSLDVQERYAGSKILPRLNLFLQSGYGRPALNFLSNSFESYYIGGARLSWTPSALYTLKNERKIIALSRSGIGIQRETFLLNVNVTLQQQNAEVDKLQKLVASDHAIIELRNSVRKAAAAQLEHGVITTSDYLREVHAADQATQTKILHDIQLLMTEYNRNITTGN